MDVLYEMENETRGVGFVKHIVLFLLFYSRQKKTRQDTVGGVGSMFYLLSVYL